MDALRWIGRAAGGAGAVLTLVAVIARFTGHFDLGGVQVGMVLQGGMAGMLAGCLAYVAVLAERDAR